jgi:arabinogalactan endo-1,4-beta-galactosidase
VLKNVGMRIMIDFHYSDSWADPAKQFKPAAWENHSFEELLKDVYNHTFDVLVH